MYIVANANITCRRKACACGGWKACRELLPLFRSHPRPNRRGWARLHRGRNLIRSLPHAHLFRMMRILLCKLYQFRYIFIYIWVCIHLNFSNSCRPSKTRSKRATLWHPSSKTSSFPKPSVGMLVRLSTMKKWRMLKTKRMRRMKKTSRTNSWFCPEKNNLFSFFSWFFFFFLVPNINSHHCSPFTLINQTNNLEENICSIIWWYI